VRSERILITGLTGRSGFFLGKAIINDPDRPRHVTAVVRSAEKFEKMFGRDSGIDYVVGDIEDRDFMVSVMKEKQIDTLFHISGILFSEGLTQCALESKTVKRLIYVHTTGIYSKYKAAGEHYREIEASVCKMLENTDVTLTVLRPTMIYGTLDDGNISVFIKMVDKLRLFPTVSHGRYALQPVNHADLGDAYYKVLKNSDVCDGKNYVLSGGTVIDLVDILKNISDFMGKKTIFVSVPFWLAYSGACVLYFVTFKKIDYREKVQRLVEPRAYSCEDAKRDFGYAPMNFLAGLKAETELYMASKKKK